MYRPIVIYISLRYMFGRISDRFSCFTSLLSIIGITLGVMALITVLSVMNGFEHELENRIIGLMPQVLLTTSSGKLDPKHITASMLDKLQGVKRIAPLTTGNVILQTAKNVAVGVMLGVNPSYSEPLASYLIHTNIRQLVTGKYQVILGSQLADQLGVQSGDQLRLIVPSVRQFTPIGCIPSQRLFTVSGIYNANSEVDGYQILVNQEDASRLMHYPIGYITGWRLWLQKPLTVDFLSQQHLPNGLVWKDWRERKGELFQAVRMEKNIMGLLLSLIVVVATFNIITSLSLLVMEKQIEIAILQTQGMTSYQLMLVFIVQGASASILGTLFGTSLGILLTNQLNKRTSVLSLLLEDAVLPVHIEPLQVITINIITISVALLSTIYPSWSAVVIHPTKALRYE